MATQLAQPPKPLLTAINQAAQDYRVPVDLLEGIWRVESGSTYPNPYKNSLGYGGLFGTTDWNGSTQSQANLAASILHNLLSKNAGDISKSLSQYSGGGYTSVPGETTFGNYIPGLGKTGGGSPPGPLGLGPEANAITGAAGAVGNAVSGAAKSVFGPVADVVQAIANFIGNIDQYLVRGGLLLGGALLFVVALAVLGRSQGQL